MIGSLLSYAIFGLALYHVAGVFALVRAYWVEQCANRELLRTLTISYGVLIVLAILEGFQDIWDSNHPGHFPLLITRPVLPIIFLVGGRAVWRLYNRRNELFKY